MKLLHISSTEIIFLELEKRLPVSILLNTKKPLCKQKKKKKSVLLIWSQSPLH